MLSSSAPDLAVIDADLQHDEVALARLLCAIKAQDLDVVIGSHYVAGFGIDEWDRR
jgi:dolichol-phosphate mannosyltransferase